MKRGRWYDGVPIEGDHLGPWHHVIRHLIEIGNCAIRSAFDATTFRQFIHMVINPSPDRFFRYIFTSVVSFEHILDYVFDIIGIIGEITSCVDPIRVIVCSAAFELEIKPESSPTYKIEIKSVCFQKKKFAYSRLKIVPSFHRVRFVILSHSAKHAIASVFFDLKLKRGCKLRF